MRRFYLVGFACLLLFDTAAQLSFKQAALDALPMSGDARWVGRVLAGRWVWIAMLGYLGAFFTWMSLLRRAPIGPAFAASHLEVVLVSALAVPLFGESLALSQLVGAAAIVAGIACLAKGEAAEPPDEAAAQKGEAPGKASDASAP